MEFKELRKQVISEEIVDEILSMIRDGRIRPGDKLPPERELAAALNVSRPSLREALSDGVVDELRTRKTAPRRHCRSGDGVASI